MLTSGLAEEYNLMENGTHLSFFVPFSSSNVAYEVRSWSLVLDVAVLIGFKRGNFTPVCSSDIHTMQT